jgi:CheY-like chemotaxis protein
MCDMIFSGVFERHPRLMLAIVEFELSWASNVLTSMDYTYRERHGEALYRFKDGMLPSDFFRRNVALRFQEDAIGINMPGMDGLELLREIKGQRPELPVMMVTAYGDEEQRRGLRYRGFNGGFPPLLRPCGWLSATTEMGQDEPISAASPKIGFRVALSRPTQHRPTV